jgi:hypothetical protein
MDELMREILTEIQAGKFAFQPGGASHQAIMDFQPLAKRVEEARRLGYIQDAKFLRGSSGDAHAVAINIAILGGLTLEGERFLLGDDDDRAF